MFKKELRVSIVLRETSYQFNASDFLTAFSRLSKVDARTRKDQILMSE